MSGCSAFTRGAKKVTGSSLHALYLPLAVADDAPVVALVEAMQVVVMSAASCGGGQGGMSVRGKGVCAAWQRGHVP